MVASCVASYRKPATLRLNVIWSFIEYSLSMKRDRVNDEITSVMKIT